MVRGDYGLISCIKAVRDLCSAPFVKRMLANVTCERIHCDVGVLFMACNKQKIGLR